MLLCENNELEEDQELASYERLCKDCGKVFMIQSSKLYTFKVSDPKSGVLSYYCCYTHWKKAMAKREKNIIAKREEYYESMRAQKNKCNKTRRDKQRGLA